MIDGRQRVNRLRWLARRGMKELDVLLEAFLEREADTLAEGGHPQLESLLAAEDDILWDWLQGRGGPDSAEQQALLDAIRA